MRIISVTSCGGCPYHRDDNGGGWVEAFTMCDRYQIILVDKLNHHDMSTVHENCKLDKKGKT